MTLFRQASVALLLLFYPVLLHAQGAVRYYDSTNYIPRVATKLNIDGSQNLELHSGGKITSISQTLLLEGGSGQSAELRAASGQSANLTFSDGGAGVQILDINGFTILKGKFGGTGGVAIQNEAGTLNLVLVDNGSSGDILVTPEASGDYVDLRAYSGDTKFRAIDDYAYIFGYPGEWAFYADATTGGVTLRGSPSGSNPHVAINDTASTVNMILVDPNGDGGVYIRPKASGDFVFIRDSNDANKLLVTDGYTELRYATGNYGINLNDTNGGVTLRGEPSGTAGAVVQNIEGTKNLIQVDVANNGNVLLQAEAVGDRVQVYDGQDVPRLIIEDSAVASGYEISLPGDITTTGELDVAKSIREHGDENVTAASHTVAVAKSYYTFDTTSNSITSTLPAINSTTRGSRFTCIHDTQGSSNTVTVQRAGADTINGATSVVLSALNDVLILRCPSSGTDWNVLGSSNTGAGGVPGTVITGMVLPYAGSSAPSGYFICDGTAVSRTTYAALFAVIGTTYGVGDGSTTFGLPDAQGRTIIGVGSGGGLTARALADTGGTETHSLTIAEMPAHSHTAAVYDTYGSQNTWFGGGPKAGSAATRSITNNTGSGSAHNIMQPFLALNAIIKY